MSHEYYRIYEDDYKKKGFYMSNDYYYDISRDDYRKKKTIIIGHDQDDNSDFIIIPDYRKTLKQETFGLALVTIVMSICLTLLFYILIPSHENFAIISTTVISLTVIIIAIIVESPLVPFTKKVAIIGKKINTDVCTMGDLLLIKNHVPDKFDSCLDAIRDFEETESIKAKDFIESTVILAQVRKSSIKENKLNNVDSKWEIEESIVKQEISIEEEMKNISNSS